MVPNLIESPVLIGREQALETVNRVLENVKAGDPRAMILSGEAGIGKTRLVAEVKERALALGFLPLQGNCFEPDRVLPYAPMLDLVRSFISSRSAEEISHYFGEGRSELARLIPELSDSHTGVPPTSPLDGETESRPFILALNRLFLRIALEQPVLLIVEDLHWSDETSLEFLLYLVRHAPSRRLLLLLTFRTEEVRAVLTHFLANLAREKGVIELPLTRLSPEQLSQMIRAIFHLERPVRREFVNAIHRLTEGNPFFTEEVLTTLIADGEVFGAESMWDRRSLDELHIPRSVQAAVQRQTEHLSQGASRVLTYAAVAGRQFDFGLLQEVARLSEAELLQVLRELRGAQLVVEETADKFAFRHALTREAVYTSLFLRERKRYHREIGETIERVYASELDLPVDDLAYHFYEAGTWDKALAYSQRAGEKAERVNAPREAIEHFTRGVEAASHLSLPPPPKLLRARGQAFETVGEFERARADYEQALKRAQEARDGLGEWQASFDLGFLWASKDYRQAGEFLRHALACARVLGKPDLLGHTLNRVGNWLVNTGQVDTGLESHREALEIFERQQSKPGIAETYDLLGMANNLAGDVPEAVENLDRAIGLFREIGDSRGLVSSLATRHSLTTMNETGYSAGGNSDELERYTAEALQLARRTSWAAGQVFVEFTSGSTFAMFGEFGKALAHGREAVRVALEIEHQQWTCAAYTHLGQVYVQMLQPAPAIEVLEAGRLLALKLGSAWWIGYNTAYLAFALLLQGEVARAEALLREAAPGKPMPRDVPERRLAWAWGETMLAQGKPQIALQTADRLIESVPGHSTAIESSLGRAEPIPALLKLKGQALLALNRHKEAERALEDARRGAMDRGVRPLLWQIHASLGILDRRLKRREEAERAFAQAREIIRSLAATIEEASLRENFTRSALEMMPRERPLSPRRMAKEAFGGLTHREREVAALVAAGKSNPEIASALVISERTATTHVSNILSKLGFTSRAQIAVWASNKGLQSSDD